MQSDIDWRGYESRAGGRPEFPIGVRFSQQHSATYFSLLNRARLVAIIFSILAAASCYVWASELYGTMPGFVAALLWCFSPTVLGHAQLITPDVGAASLGVTASYFFWRWLKRGGWSAAALAGVSLGLAELTKTTWLVLVAMWPVIWVISCRLSASKQRCTNSQIATILLIGLSLINIGYAFEGTFTKLGDFQFVSRMLSGNEQVDKHLNVVGNRFAESSLAWLPIPLPKNYVLGLDTQKREFEISQWSYLRGKWSRQGWWYYYVYAFAIKEPVAIWVLILGAIFWRGASPATWGDEFVLLSTMLTTVVLVSSQTGLNHHLRYLLPAYPFLFIWVSRLACRQSSELRSPVVSATRSAFLRTACVVIALVGFTVSSLSIFPHSLSYFNELVGGPRNGSKHLLHSNTDWGQDLLYLRRWLDRHPEVEEMNLVWDAYVVSPELIGIDRMQYWTDDAGSIEPTTHKRAEPRSCGWYIISVNQLYDRLDRHAHFRRLTPVDTVGYSLNVYFVRASESEQAKLPTILPSKPVFRLN